MLTQRQERRITTNGRTDTRDARLHAEPIRRLPASSSSSSSRRRERDRALGMRLKLCLEPGELRCGGVSEGSRRLIQIFLEIGSSGQERPARGTKPP